MDDRYIKNIGSLSAEEMAKIRKKSVCVVGCGGLGGYIIEYLLRLGVGGITAVDGDVFCRSNLNRQLLCTDKTMGKSKALSAEDRAQKINPDVRFTAIDAFLDINNAADIISQSDVIIDALDNTPARKLLFSACAHEGKLLIHGGVDGWQVQVAVISPEINAAALLTGGAASNIGTLSFIPAFCASVQVAQCAKLLCGRDADLLNKLMCADLATGESSIIELA